MFACFNDRVVHIGKRLDGLDTTNVTTVSQTKLDKTIQMPRFEIDLWSLLHFSSMLSFHTNSCWVISAIFYPDRVNELRNKSHVVDMCLKRLEVKTVTVEVANKYIYEMHIYTHAHCSTCSRAVSCLVYGLAAVATSHRSVTGLNCEMENQSTA